MENNLVSQRAKLCPVVLMHIALAMVGCARHQDRPSITAVGLSPANRCEPHGIPYYLPKPLLVVSKNVRHIDESKVGLTGPAPIPGGFDNQAAYADIKANVTVPPSSSNKDAASEGLQAVVETNPAGVSSATLGAELSKSTVAETMIPLANANFDDGLETDSFFTYQIVFVPDLTQKYGLRISGGAGEVRAAMNLVNGWMYTGMGPYYFKDSSSAQNAMASGVGAMYAGRGVSDVVNSVGDLATDIAKAAKRESGLTESDIVKLDQQMRILNALARSTPKVPQEILNYAEIYIYEPILMGDQTEWRLVAEHHFNRHYFDNAADQATRENQLNILNTMLNSLATGSNSRNENATVDGAGSEGSVTASLTTPKGSVLKLQENGAAESTKNESGSTDGSSQPTPVQPADKGAEILNKRLQTIGRGSGVSSEPSENSPKSMGLPVDVAPQIEINVLSDSLSKETLMPRPRPFPCVDRLCNPQNPKVINRQGDITTGIGIQ